MLDRPWTAISLSRLVALMDRFDLHAIRLFPDPPPALAMPGFPDWFSAPRPTQQDQYPRHYLAALEPA